MEEGGKWRIQWKAIKVGERGGTEELKLKVKTGRIM